MVTGASKGAGQRDDLTAALVDAQRRVDQLETALASRVVIEQAKGVLRERFGWSIEEAFDMLRYSARSARVRIHEVAGAVVASHETPLVITIALARSSRMRAAHLQEHAESQLARTTKLLAELRQHRLRFEAAGRQKERGA